MMKTEKPWIVTDMDGTLLNDGKTVSRPNQDALHKAREAGLHVMVATGRDYVEASTPLKEAGIEVPLICVNGSDIRDINGKIISQQTLTVQTYKGIRRILEEENIYFEIYTTGGSFTNDREQGFELVTNMLMLTGEFPTYNEAKKIAEWRFNEGFIQETESYDDLLHKEGIGLLKILAFTKDQTKRIRANERLSLMDVTVTSSSEDNIEIMHCNATKGRGIIQMADIYGLDVKNAVVFGDNENDRSMMEAAGYAVAMGNALPAIRRISDQVTSTNIEHGVAEVIEQLLAPASVRKHSHWETFNR